MKELFNLMTKLLSNKPLNNLQKIMNKKYLQKTQKKNLKFQNKNLQM